MSAETNQEVKITCVICNKDFQIVVREPDYLDYKNDDDKTAEQCFPYLNKEQQDLLDGNICRVCTENIISGNICEDITDEEFEDITDEEFEDMIDEDE